ncbi:MAG: tyrosine--tRNA ligase [Candidatus Nomurabacteria bacterium]|jgi:tyrosyl-tRNA synthetase|nr:tyrosine--tRNA ligase [Candidatus Nomurabacteria bacterium]
MKLSEELVWRGFVAENTLKNVSDLDERARSFYWGTDPSADSLHVGHLAALMMCACFIRYGYKPYLLVGGATGQIGDPKDNAERDLKPMDEIEHNKAALVAQIRQVVQEENVVMVDNWDWFREIKYIDFLRTVGKEFSMTQLLDRKFVQDRVGEGGVGISYAEFSYSLIQGYDFLHLYREYGIDMQLCGADQFGNCVSGMHLIKRLEGAEADAWSCPLIIDQASGRKFGKSEGNAVWLDAEKTPVFDFYQFWLNQSDDAVEDYLKYYTLMMPDELAELMAAHFERPQDRLAQKRLAEEATTVVHGREATESVIKITTVLFGKMDVDTLSEADISLLEKTIPTVGRGANISEALVSTGVAKSKSEARQLIVSDAISVNNEKVGEDIEIAQRAIIKKGKNKFILVK